MRQLWVKLRPDQRWPTFGNDSSLFSERLRDDLKARYDCLQFGPEHSDANPEIQFESALRQA